MTTLVWRWSSLHSRNKNLSASIWRMLTLMLTALCVGGAGVRVCLRGACVCGGVRASDVDQFYVFVYYVN